MTPQTGLALPVSPSFFHSSSALDWASAPNVDAALFAVTTLDSEDAAAMLALKTIATVSTMSHPEPAMLLEALPTDVDVNPLVVGGYESVGPHLPVYDRTEEAAINSTSYLKTNAFGLITAGSALKSGIRSHSKVTAAESILTETAAEEVLPQL